MSLASSLRSAIAASIVVLVTGVSATAAMLLAPIAPRLALKAAHLWGRACLSLIGARLEVEGMHHVDPLSQYVIMANHESSLDICSLLAALPSSLGLRFLAKESLFRIPFLGWAMKALRFIPVNREEGRTAIMTLNSAIDAIQRGGSPLVFPEQTWTKDGRLLPFQRGGFLIALRTGLPILPIGLEGPRLLLPPGSRRPRTGMITLRVGEPIPTSSLKISDRGELTKRTREAIDRLRGPSGHLSDPTENGNESSTATVHTRDR